MRNTAGGLVPGDDVDGDGQGGGVLDEAGQFDVGQFEGRDPGQAQGGDGGDGELQQELAGLLGEEVPKFDHDEPVTELLGGQVVVEAQELHRGFEPDHEGQGLDDLVEQPVDLPGDRGAGGVGVVGEDVVPGPGSGDRGQQGLVVPAPVPEGGGHQAVGVGLGGEGGELLNGLDAGVDVPVGDDEHGAPGGGDPADLPQPPQVPGPQVGGPTRVDALDEPDHGVLVGQRSGGDDDLGGVVEGDQPEVVGGLQTAHQRDQRLLRALQRGTTHGPGPVQDHLQRRRRAGRVLGGGGGVQFEQDSDLVRGLVGDDIDVQQGIDLHDSFSFVLSSVGVGWWFVVNRRLSRRGLTRTHRAATESSVPRRWGFR